MNIEQFLDEWNGSYSFPLAPSAPTDIEEYFSVVSHAFGGQQPKEGIRVLLVADGNDRILQVFRLNEHGGDDDLTVLREVIRVLRDVKEWVHNSDASELILPKRDEEQASQPEIYARPFTDEDNTWGASPEEDDPYT